MGHAARPLADLALAVVALMLLDKIKAHIWALAAIAAGALLATQTVRLHTEQRAHQVLITSTAQATAARAQAALQQETRTAAQESTHAVQTQKASDAFTQAQPARSSSLRADLDRVERLRLDADRRAATYRAQARASAAAGSSAADRLVALDQHIVEGVAVVADLRGVVAKRDAEVVLLRSVIDADRALQK